MKPMISRQDNFSYQNHSFTRSGDLKRPSDSRKIEIFVYPIILLLFVFASLCFILPEHTLFGSEGDWFSQHVAIAEQYRTAFYETGNLFPDWLPLGAGSNSYDFSYYGFLRPDVLISFLLPGVPMTYIISGYAILELAIGTLLCYFWLKRHVSLSFFAFLGATLYSFAACFFHAHRQIMFVNYMPFLILALWGIEMLMERGKIQLLTISILLVCLHSYYFAPAVLITCTAYFLQYLSKGRQTINQPTPFYRLILSHRYLCAKFAASILLAVGMAAILLLPTALDLLSTVKDAGTPASLLKIFSLQGDLKSLLYHPYGCGLTILCLYTLLLSIRRKTNRILSIFLLLCLAFNLLPYILSGFLYVRYKVLIPLVPLLLLLCVQTLEALYVGREKHSLPLGVLCLIPAIFADYRLGILADSLWLFFSFVIISMGKRRFTLLKSESYSQSRSAVLPRQIRWLYLLLCLPAMCFHICASRTETFISTNDQRQSLCSKQEQSAIDETDKNYRFERLIEPFANTNTQPLPGFGRTSMYSSVTDYRYADFFYNTMRNPIRIRNRVALMTDANPFFSYFMGIRYIEANPDFLPWGYQAIAKSDNLGVLAENPNVLPIAYSSTALMSQKEFEKLSFPYTLEALTRCTLVPDNLEKKQLDRSSTYCSADQMMAASKIRPLALEDFHLPQTADSETKNQEDTHLTLPVPTELNSHLLILSVKVSSPKGTEVTIDINNIRNKLSGKHAAYPNHNNTFTWILSSNDRIETLDFVLSSGDYKLSDWQAWSMDTEAWGNNTIQPLLTTKEAQSHPQAAGSLLVNGKTVLDESGYFCTSFPFRKGYKAFVNGIETPITCINQTFVGVPLASGSYEISLYYCPLGKHAAIWISLLSCLLFIAWSIYDGIETQPRK